MKAKMTCLIISAALCFLLSCENSKPAVEQKPLQPVLEEKTKEEKPDEYMLPGFQKIKEGVSIFIIRPKVMVDYTKTLEQMISAGKYYRPNCPVDQKYFPSSSNGKVEKELVLFHFNPSVETYKAIEEMDKAGYEPGDIVDLLALGASHPELQETFSIVSLKPISSETGFGGYQCRYVPVLSNLCYNIDNEFSRCNKNTLCTSRFASSDWGRGKHEYWPLWFCFLGTHK